MCFQNDLINLAVEQCHEKILGHKQINSTMKYTQLVHFKADEFHVSTATTVDEAKDLLATGFITLQRKRRNALQKAENQKHTVNRCIGLTPSCRALKPSLCHSA